MKIASRILTLALLISISGLASQAIAGTASVTGKVLFDGPAPAREKIKMAADPVCQTLHSNPPVMDDVIVNNGTLQNVLVYVKEDVPGAPPAPSEPVVFDQVGCLYTPHVLGIRVDQPLEIHNSDATLHNVNAQPTKSPKFNLAMPVKGMKSTKKFTAPEVPVKVKCNVHPWMSGYIGVFNHPYFGVTGENGTFNLAGLPAGTYTVEAWHEKFGVQSQSVTVADGEAKQIQFTFKAP